MATDTTPATVDKPPFLIASIAAFLVWLEILVVTVSSLMLTFVAVLTVASALNGGQLLQTNAFLNAAYAWCQGIGIEGQLSGMAYQATKLCRSGKGWQGCGFWLLTLILAGVSIMAGGAVNYQQTFHVTFPQALAHVGVNQEVWVWARVVVLIGLIVLAAAMRYQPATKEGVEVRIARMREQAQLAQARAELLSQNAGAVLGGLRKAVQSARTAAPTVAAAEEAPAPLA